MLHGSTKCIKWTVHLEPVYAHASHSKKLLKSVEYGQYFYIVQQVLNDHTVTMAPETFLLISHSTNTKRLSCGRFSMKKA